jgi:hypothetical protein
VSEEQVSEALEAARCAYANLHNMVRMTPMLERHPLLGMVKLQLRTAIEKLGDTTFCEMEDSL